MECLCQFFTLGSFQVNLQKYHEVGLDTKHYIIHDKQSQKKIINKTLTVLGNLEENNSHKASGVERSKSSHTRDPISPPSSSC